MWLRITAFAEPVVAALPWLVGTGLVVCVAVSILKRIRGLRLARDPQIIEISPPDDVALSGAEVFWTNLHDLLRPRLSAIVSGQPHLSFELFWQGPSVRIRLWVPRGVPLQLVENAVGAAWQGAVTQIVECDHVKELKLPTLAAGRFRLHYGERLPLRTDHSIDPLRALFAALSTLGSGGRAIVQVLARPVSSRRMGGLHRIASNLRSGKSHSRMLRLLDLILPSHAPESSVASNPRLNDDIRMILSKASQLGWEVSIRYAVASPATGRHARRVAREQVHALASSFVLHSGRNRLRRCRVHRPYPMLASRRLGTADLVGVNELAAIAHLPADRTITGLDRSGGRRVSPVSSIPSAGVLLGDSDGVERRQVAIAHADMPYHVHVMGSTGTGKSTLLTNMVLGDVHAGRGAVVIDPKGDLITDILDRLHPNDVQQVALLDPSEPGVAPQLDVLSGDDPQLAVDNVVGIFRNIFEAYWGPRTDDVLRAACLTLRTRATASLADVPLLLSDSDFRRRFAQGLNDRVGLGGFWNWYESLTESHRAQIVGPVLGKLRAFLLRDFVRNVVVPGNNVVSLDEVLDGKLLLVRIPKGILGPETVKLLGSLVVARVWQAALNRTSSGRGARLGATLYVDECHNFLNLPGSVEDMLAESRGYGLSMVLAHQHLGQLRGELRTALSANARNKVFFSMSPEDAKSLERHFLPELAASDLVRIGGYRIAGRIVVNGKDSPAFTAATHPAATYSVHNASVVRDLIRRQGGT